MKARPLSVAGRRPIVRLGLRAGDDIAGGTGVNFMWLEAHIGEAGRIVGGDLGSDMLAGVPMAAIGAKWAPRPALPVNILVSTRTGRAVPIFEGFRRRWSPLVERAGGLQESTAALGGAYVAAGSTPWQRAT